MKLENSGTFIYFRDLFCKIGPNSGELLLAITPLLCSCVLASCSNSEFETIHTYWGMKLVSQLLDVRDYKLFWVMNFFFLGFWQTLAVGFAPKFPAESQLWRKAGLMIGLFFWSTIAFATAIFTPKNILWIFFLMMFFSSIRWYIQFTFNFNLADVVKRYIHNFCSALVSYVRA